jgi:hypothetical protein
MSLTPDERFPNHFGFIGIGKMPQQPLACLFVNKRSECCVIRFLPKMQIDYVRTMLDTTLIGWRISHFFPPLRIIAVDGRNGERTLHRQHKECPRFLLSGQPFFQRTPVNINAAHSLTFVVVHWCSLFFIARFDSGLSPSAIRILPEAGVVPSPIAAGAALPH